MSNRGRCLWLTAASVVLGLSLPCLAQTATDPGRGDRVAAAEATATEPVVTDSHLSRLMLLVHRARVEAELTDRSDISFTEEVRGARGLLAVARVMRDESVIFESRRSTLLSQLQGYRDAAIVARREIQILKSKDALLVEQIRLLSQQLENVSELLGRGSASVNQKMVLSQSLAQYKTAHLDLELAILKSTQEYQTVIRNIDDIQSQRRAENLLALSLTEDKLADLGRESTVRVGRQDAGQKRPIKPEVLGLRGTTASPLLALSGQETDDRHLVSQTR